MRSPYSALLAVAIATVVLVLPIQGQQNAMRDTSPRTLDMQGGKIREVTVATGLFHPWSLAFLDARTILVPEKNGRLRIVRDGVLSPTPVWTSPTSTGATGDALHAIAVHPKFAENNLIYMSYPKNGERGTTLAVARGRLKGSVLEDVQEIFVAEKFPRWKNNLFVGALTSRQLVRVAFGQPSQAERREGLMIPIDVRPRDVQQSPDGYIYVVTEQASGGNNADGMILRIEPAEQ